MSQGDACHVYGPVPSRRLGRSLGVDLVPFKTCTYDCIYCQLGRTTNKTLERKEYVPVEQVLNELERKLAQDAPDYISLAGSGEPTLNAGIGRLIRAIRGMTDIPVAVLTNGSLLWMSDVQDDLAAANLILPSLDAGDARFFQYVNRPRADISYERMVDGIAAFTKRFPGEVWLEVFLLAGVSAIPAQVRKIAAVAQRIAPARIQLNTVARPPAEDFALAVPPDRMRALKPLFHGRVDIISENGRDVSPAAAHGAAGGDEIMALLSRRPCTSMDVANGLGIHVMEALKQLQALVAAGKAAAVATGAGAFFVAVHADDAGSMAR